MKRKKRWKALMLHSDACKLIEAKRIMRVLAALKRGLLQSVTEK